MASTSGETGVIFSEALREEVPVVAVSHEEMSSSNKQKIRELGAEFVEKTYLPLHAERMGEVREIFRTLGQGFKRNLLTRRELKGRGSQSPVSLETCFKGSSGMKSTFLLPYMPFPNNTSSSNC